MFHMVLRWCEIPLPVMKIVPNAVWGRQSSEKKANCLNLRNCKLSYLKKTVVFSAVSGLKMAFSILFVTRCAQDRWADGCITFRTFRNKNFPTCRFETAVRRK